MCWRASGGNAGEAHTAEVGGIAIQWKDQGMNQLLREARAAPALEPRTVTYSVWVPSSFPPAITQERKHRRVGRLHYAVTVRSLLSGHRKSPCRQTHYARQETGLTVDFNGASQDCRLTILALKWVAVNARAVVAIATLNCITDGD